MQTEILIGKLKPLLKNYFWPPPQPENLRAIQSSFRGAVRFGYVPLDGAGVPGHFHYHCRKVLERNQLPAPDVDQPEIFRVVHQDETRFRKVIRKQKLPRWLSCSPKSHAGQQTQGPLVNSPDHARNYVRILRVIAIPYPIEICGHHADEVAPIFLAIRLAKLDSGDLRQSVTLVRGFERPSQEIFLKNRILSEFWVGARTAEKQKLLNTAFSRVFEDIHLDSHVVKHEFHRFRRISDNSAHSCRAVKDILGLIAAEGPPYLRGACQIDLLMTPGDQITVATRREGAADCTSHQTPVPGDQNTRILVHTVNRFRP